MTSTKMLYFGLSAFVILNVLVDFTSSASGNSVIREANSRLAADLVRQRTPGNCKATEYDCGEKCINITRWRDCKEDCDDKSDEECWPGMIKCPGTCTCVDKQDEAALCVMKSENKLCSLAGSFHCNNGNCIQSVSVNDKVNDCGDWSDETGTISSLTKKSSMLGQK